MDLETLYPLITESIRRAEVLEDLQAPGARDAWHDVSRLEERIAALLPASDPEGAIARRGAVSAAVSGGEFERALTLVARFKTEGDVSAALVADLTIVRPLMTLFLRGEARLAGRRFTPTQFGPSL